MKTKHIPLTFFKDFQDALQPIMAEAESIRVGGHPASVLAQFQFAEFDAKAPERKTSYNTGAGERRVIELRVCLVPATAVEKVHAVIEKARAKMDAASGEDSTTQPSTTP